MFVIAGQNQATFGMPEMFPPSQILRHHLVLERTAMLFTDRRYFGVTKGACIGHLAPEACRGGRIAALMDGDLLDSVAFLAGELIPPDDDLLDARTEIIAERRRRMEKRRDEVSAANLLDELVDAEHGAVPRTVDRRATVA